MLRLADQRTAEPRPNLPLTRSHESAAHTCSRLTPRRDSDARPADHVRQGQPGRRRLPPGRRGQHQQRVRTHACTHGTHARAHTRIWSLRSPWLGVALPSGSSPHSFLAFWQAGLRRVRRVAGARLQRRRLVADVAARPDRLAARPGAPPLAPLPLPRPWPFSPTNILSAPRLSPLSSLFSLLSPPDLFLHASPLDSHHRTATATSTTTTSMSSSTSATPTAPAPSRSRS